MLHTIPPEKLAAAGHFPAALREADPEEAADAAAWFAAREEFEQSSEAPIP